MRWLDTLRQTELYEDTFRKVIRQITSDRCPAGQRSSLAAGIRIKIPIHKAGRAAQNSSRERDTPKRRQRRTPQSVTAYADSINIDREHPRMRVHTQGV